MANRPVILGQSRALQTLRAALRSGRMHHAWIFSGPRGVGKFTAAIEVARALLDREATAEGIGGEGLTQSRIQGLIDSGTHPDLHIIRKELALFSDNPQLRQRKLLSIPLDLLRERVIGGTTSDERQHEAPAYRTAALGHGKVFIIDEAELLAWEAQNTLLKTLEEPPPRTYFFLITSQPQRLASTIHSRCQHVRFGRLDDESMQLWLRAYLANQPQVKAAQADLAWALEFAEGAPGIAKLAIEYGFARWQQALEPMIAELERGRFPVQMGEALAGLVEEFAAAWAKANKNASKDAANKDGARHVLALLATHCRRMLRRTAAGDESPHGVRPNAESDLAPGTALHAVLNAIDVIRQAERAMHANVNLKLLLEDMVAQWATVRLEA